MFGGKAGCIIVEGAGGVLVPVDAGLTMLHLIRRIDFPVVLVTSCTLGTLNHTFLSLCALQSSGVLLAGVVMTNTDGRTENYIYKDNRKTVQAFCGRVPFLAIGYRGGRTTHSEEFCNELAKRYF